MTLPAAWRARWWTWAVPLAVVLVNAALLVVHPGRTGAGFADMKKELDAETKVLNTLVGKERVVTAVLTDARSSREAVAALYRDRFSTEAERLTRLITEVKRLAQRAGLEPESISYPEETIDAYGLVRKSLVFGVQGTYGQLRTLVNLLELSDLFLVLERVGLRDSASSVLGINLEISTFFVREPEVGVAAAEPRAERSSARRSGDPSSGERSTDDPSSPELGTGELSIAEPSTGDSSQDELSIDQHPIDQPSSAVPSDGDRSGAERDGSAGSGPSNRRPQS